MECFRPHGGPVAQLGARLNGIQEVTGSIPVGSTRADALKQRAARAVAPEIRSSQRREERFLTVWSLGIDLASGGFAVVRGFCALAWLFDIVKRVLTYSLRRGAGVCLRGVLPM